jgi:hypothetical protein
MYLIRTFAFIKIRSNEKDKTILAGAFLRIDAVPALVYENESGRRSR